ncbi:MAG: hypothetical protein HRF49_04775 [bacterium]
MIHRLYIAILVSVFLAAFICTGIFAQSDFSSAEFFVVIRNTAGGEITAVNRLGGGEALPLGKVLAPCATISQNGFTASGWGKTGCITGTAVNAIHCKVGQNPETGFGKIFSILPVEFANFDPTNYLSYYNKEASIFTDLHAGGDLFGGGFAPKVGSPFLISPAEEPDAKFAEKVVVPEFVAGFANASGFFACPLDYTPKVGDVIAIKVSPSEGRNIEWIEFENKFGGFISVKYAGDEPVVLGQVYKPVFGVGRFEGTVYCGPGRIRANHPGVIDISTSPLGQIGGIQIIPLEHAMSPELKYARVLTQWMVVGPIDPRQSPVWEGLSPLFSGEIYPSYIPVEDKRFGDLDVFLGRFQIVVQMKGGDGWQLMPIHIGRDDEALLGLEKLKILFPL